MTWEENKKALLQERKTCEEKLDDLLQQHYKAKPGEGEAIQRHMARLARTTFAIDYIILINEHAGITLSPETRMFLEMLAMFAKDRPDGIIIIRDRLDKSWPDLRVMIEEAQEVHVLEMRKRDNSEFTGYILRNDFTNQHQIVHGDPQEVNAIMRSED